MTTAITTSDPLIALAEHELDLDSMNADLDAESLRAARNQEQTTLQEQIKKLHEAADDVRTGALVQGAFSLAGAAASMSGSLSQPDSVATALKGAGAALTALAAPAGRLAGEAPQRDHDADAKLAEAYVVDARARAEEADHHRQRMEQAGDRTLSAIDAILSSEAQGNLALIANV